MLTYSGCHHPPPVRDAPALEVSGLSTTYEGSRVSALENVNLKVRPGERIALVGANGAGKSSLLKVVANLLPRTRGTVRIFGHPCGTCHHRVSFLPQRSELDWRFPVDVERLVLAGRYVHMGWLRPPSETDRKLVQEKIALLQLDHLRGRQIGQLSGGQQQRAILARTLVQEAELLLLDEPLNAVDARTRKIITDVLDHLKDQGKTVVMATHDIGRLDSDFDQAVFMQDGKQVPPPPDQTPAKHTS